MADALPLVIGEVLKTGFLGSFCCALGYAVYWLWKDGNTARANHVKELRDVTERHDKAIADLHAQYAAQIKVLSDDMHNLHERRVTEARSVQDQLLDNNTLCVRAIADTTNAMEAMKEVTGELQITLRSMDRVFQK